MTVKEIKEKLDMLKVSYKSNASKADLEKLLNESISEVTGTQTLVVSEPTSSEQEITVRDPEVLRPKVLPLIVELPADASKAQQQFAATLNAYAYKNPDKWAKKKDALIKRLKELKNAPDPVKESLTFKNKLLDN